MDMDFKHDNYHEIMVLGKPETIHFQVEASFCDLISKMTSYLGRQPVPPDWLSTGAILGIQGGTEKVQNTSLDPISVATCRE